MPMIIMKTAKIRLRPHGAVSGSLLPIFNNMDFQTCVRGAPVMPRVTTAVHAITSIQNFAELESMTAFGLKDQPRFSMPLLRGPPSDPLL